MRIVTCTKKKKKKKEGLVGILIYELVVTGVAPHNAGFDIVALRELMINLAGLWLLLLP